MIERARPGRTRRLAAAGLAAAAVIAGTAACGDSGDMGDARPMVTVARPAGPMSPADARDVERAVAAVYAPRRAEFPGLWVGVWDPDTGVYTGAFGTAVKNGAAATAADAFRIGSVTKTFTATVVLQLVDEDRIGLNDTVSDVDAEIAGRYPQLADLTIRQLLAMRSGVPDYMNVPDAIVAQLTAEPQRVFSADELIAEGLSGSVAPAGTSGYSSTNYIVLQEVAESVTGRTIEDLIAERVTRPLGMSDVTALPSDGAPSLPDPSSHGYLNAACAEEIAWDGGEAAPGTDTSRWNVSYGQGAGGMSANLDDLGIWAASMSGNALLSDATARARLRTAEITPGLRYGLGIMRLGDWYGHEGEALGWEAIALHDPSTGVSIVLATNACAGATELFLPIVASLYPGTGLLG